MFGRNLCIEYPARGCDKEPEAGKSSAARESISEEVEVVIEVKLLLLEGVRGAR